MTAASKHFLAATDLSVPSLHAVDRGFLLAREGGARYTVMHALAIDTPEEFRQLLGERLAAVLHNIEQHALESLAAVVSDPTRHAGVSAAIRVEPGLAFSAIPACAEALGADLVLLGARGEGFLQTLLLGSTASRLLRKSRCPVLVVKQPAEQAYRRVLIPVDFSPASGLAIRMARQVAPDAYIVLLHVFEAPFEGKMAYAGVDEEFIAQYRAEAREHALERMRELAAAAGLTAANHARVVLPGNPAREILEEERKHRHDLIVMGKHGTHLTEELLLGSLTKRVLAESLCDVLVVVDERPPAPDPKPA